MPTLYSPHFRKATRRRAQFARSMMLEEFGYRYGRAIDQSDFFDRLPHQRPLRIHEIGARR